MDTSSLLEGLPSEANLSSSNNLAQMDISNDSRTVVDDESTLSESEQIPEVEGVERLSAAELSERIRTISEARVISEQIGESFKGKRLESQKNDSSDLFSPSVNLAELFAVVDKKDVQTLSLLASKFETQQEEFESQNRLSKALVGSSITITSGFSVGYLIYLIRGGAIVSSMLSSLPAWRFVDPLPILGSMGADGEGDSETLESIVSKGEGGKR